MAWTTPKTWSVDELLTAADLNEQLRDNMNELKAPPSANYELDESSDFTTTSTTFVDVGAALELTVNTNGGDVMVHFHGAITNQTGGEKVMLDVAVDGVREAGDDGIVLAKPSGAFEVVPVCFTRLITGLSAGAHTFKLQWAVSAGTGYLYAGAGSSVDTHGQFWAREVS